jgi:5-methylcytosine-specific restriction endonuclease McrA
MSITAEKLAHSRWQPVGQWITKWKRLAIYLRDGFACVYCERDMRADDPYNVTLDHLTPRSAGGSDDASNLVTACRSCNSKRGARDWRDNPPHVVARIRRNVRRVLNGRLARAILAGKAGDPRLEQR